MVQVAWKTKSFNRKEHKEGAKGAKAFNLIFFASLILKPL